MPELLLELLSEEIPARMQARAAEDLRRGVTERLTGAGLAFEEARAYVTPRRLALVVTGLPKKQPDTQEEKKGPRLDAPEKAIQGFLRGHNLASIDQAEVRQTAKGSFYFLVRERKGQATAQVLPGIIVEAIQAFTWPKSMRWGTNYFVWVRPIQSILCVFDGKPIDGGITIGTIISKEEDPHLDDWTGPYVIPFENVTRGHRFLAPEMFSVQGFADYKKKLKAAKVILDPAERRAVIVKQAKQKASRAKLVLKDDPALLDEVTGLVEWPVVLLGRIDPEFMDLPPEVLTTAMRAHQKYLALVDESGALANRFLVVANMETADRGKEIAAGNERVLRARLADARFFWDQDRKRTLESRIEGLDGVTFHAKLGSLGEKVRRIEKLAVEIAAGVPGTDKAAVSEAARLCKADLTTGMVGEFPELQGIMGRYYALEESKSAEIANAIALHYLPKGGTDCPTIDVAATAVVIGLADRIDSLVGFFAIDETPTGSKDPFALRRAALGVIRIILENKLRLGLRSLLDSALNLYDPEIFLGSDALHDYNLAGDAKSSIKGLTVAEEIRLPTVLSLLNFFSDRLKVALKESGVRHDLIAAVFAVGGEDDLVRLLARVDALAKFLDTDNGANLLVAYQRAANIVRIEEKRDKLRYHGAELAIDQLVEEAERALGLRVFDSEAAAEKALEAEDFTAAMAALAKLRQPVDDFFDRVTVNTENPELRANRLRLLARIGATLDQVADFSKIEG